ncbi:MAG TPA: hypothetical protein VG843_09985 [Rhizomicrobium sp.]|jgi:hypothetical protein|nr:hypothetical protein [Rhizomicrobium sp.]
MRASLYALAVATMAALATPVSAARPVLVYRVDNATATVVRNRLVITAEGAVRSGGWEKPRLRVSKAYPAEATTLQVLFVAKPPLRVNSVVQALIPIGARKAAPLPRYGAKQVRVIAQTNSIIVPITTRR